MGAAATTFTFAANAKLARSRDHTFSENIQLSTRQIYLYWKSGTKAYDCPMADTNHSGTLGLKDIVSMAASTPNLDDALKSGQKTVFGGTVQFVVTKSVSATGPGWQLVRFNKVAALTSLSEVNTDKVTLAFAQGSNTGRRLPRINGFKPQVTSFCSGSFSIRSTRN